MPISRPVPFLFQTARRTTSVPAVFALHTTVSAMLALSMAVLLGLSHPWWAAMTVWLVAQPTRGLFLERCLARLLGTTVGALVGGGLLVVFVGNHVVLLGALALWLMACAALGGSLRHFRSYAAVLAGYTASIVALFAFMDADVDFEQAAARIACTVIGIGISAMVSAIFYRRSGGGDLEQAVSQFAQRCVQWAAPASLRTAPQSRDALAKLMRDAHKLENSLEDMAAGSLSARRAIGVARTRLFQAVEELSVASLGREGGSLTNERVPDTVAALPDYRSIARAAVRPALALGLAASAWLLTGWQAGPIMVMAAVIFASLFSSHERGNQALRTVLLGTFIGAFAGLAFRALLMPYIDGYTTLVLLLTPFLASGAFLMARPASGKMAIDMNMSFLLVAQPSFPLRVAQVSALEEAIAMLLGVGCAWLTYAAFLPSDPQVNRRHQVRSIRRLVRAVIEEDSPGKAWRQRRSMSSALLALSAGEPAQAGLPAAGLACLGWTSLLCAARARTHASPTAVADQPELVRRLNEATAELCNHISSRRSRN